MRAQMQYSTLTFLISYFFVSSDIKQVSGLIDEHLLKSADEVHLLYNAVKLGPSDKLLKLRRERP